MVSLFGETMESPAIDFNVVAVAREGVIHPVPLALMGERHQLWDHLSAILP